MSTSNNSNNHCDIICERLLALKSWTDEQKTRLLEIIIEWTTKYEQSVPTQLNNILQHLRELFTHNVIIVPLLPVETILKVIQSSHIPAELWLDCLMNAVESPSDNNNENKILFDFTPVTIPTTVSTSSTLFNSYLSEQGSQNDRCSSMFDRSSIKDTNLTDPFFSFCSSLTMSTSTFHRLPSEESLEEYQTRLLGNLQELYQLKWDQLSVESLRCTFTNPENFNNLSSIKKALFIVETIVVNRISLQSHIKRIVNNITKKSSNKWMDELNKIVNEQRKNKSLQTLLQELRQVNSFINLDNLKQQYKKVMNYYEQETIRMTSSDIQNQQNYYDEFYKIAVIIQGVYIFKQVRPRDIQILSLLLFIESKHKNRGRLAQICTGEGKSIIVAMLAVYLSLASSEKYVDIITTSEILAQRDAQEFAPFYQMFNLTVGHNCRDPSETPNYRFDIIYGTINQFAGDLLRTEFYLNTEVRGDRPYSIVIVDEVGSMFIDQREHFTQLASLTPGYKSLNIILKFIFIFFKKYNITENNEFVIKQENGFVKVDALRFIREKLNDKQLIEFSEFRRSYILFKLPKWIQSARRALYELQLDIDYIINKENEIVVVDYLHTGVSQLNMHWSDGIHQFLQLKHNLRMTPEHMCDSFYSNVTLFKKYEYLYGLTGTLGGKDAQNFIKTLYNIDVVIIPKYMDSVFDIYPNQFADNRQLWLEKIRIECHTIAITNRRAILIICQTIRDANDVQSYLSSQHSNIKLYLRSDEHTKPEEVCPCDVIVATNLAGRGTDLKVLTSVVDRGGLHVIVTFMPNNSRVEQQAFGRTGRQGQPGSARLIIYKEYDNMISYRSMNEIQIVENWKQARDKFERDNMNEAIEEVNRIEAKDRLLVRFLNVVYSRKGDLSFTEDILQPGFGSLRELWSSFCDEDLSTADQRFPAFANEIEQKLDRAIATMKQTLSQPCFLFPWHRDEEQRHTEHIANATCDALRHLIVHPKYFIMAGIKMLCMKNIFEREKRALTLYQQAANLDKQDFILHYNMVSCYIKNDQNSINEALKELNIAVTLLCNEIERRKLLQIHDDSSSQTSVDRSCIAELVYLEHVHSIFEASRDQLRKFDEDKHKITCRSESWEVTLSSLENTHFKAIKSEIHTEYQEWYSEGLVWVFIFEIEAKRCWWKTIFVFVMGIAQIVGGAFLCVAGQWKLGTSMVLNGIFDVYAAVATKITADFDLVNYYKQKVITYGLNLLCITPAVSNLVKPIASIEQTRIVGVAAISTHKLSTKGFTIEVLTNTALTSMNIAGIDNHTIDFLKQIPERYKDIEALISGDFDQIINQGTSMMVNQFLGTLDNDSLFGGKTKEIFQIVQRHTPLIKHVYDGNSKAIVSYALNTMDDILPNIPIIDTLGLALPYTLHSVVKKEVLEINNLFLSTIKKLNSTNGEHTSQTLDIVQKILYASDKWTVFEQNKDKLNTEICQLLRPAIERELKLLDEYEQVMNNPQVFGRCCEIFRSSNVTFGTIQNQHNNLQGEIRRKQTDNHLLQQSIITFIDELSKTTKNIRKSSKTTNAFKEYLNDSIIRPSIENACEQEMDKNDEKIMDKFTKALIYIQEQQKNFNET
ncbi:unnamed protein product [Rotaria sp. Silwood1]|nr:unnamed protein product [Rotaria sp. Silwood1]CAF1547172.1 unnamed protein product [Rotaria sp. Silwood1]